MMQTVVERHSMARASPGSSTSSSCSCRHQSRPGAQLAVRAACSWGMAVPTAPLLSWHCAHSLIRLPDIIRCGCHQALWGPPGNPAFGKSHLTALSANSGEFNEGCGGTFQHLFAQQVSEVPAVVHGLRFSWIFWKLFASRVCSSFYPHLCHSYLQALRQGISHLPRHETMSV